MRHIFLLLFLFPQQPNPNEVLCKLIKANSDYQTEGVRIFETESGNFLVSISSASWGKQSKNSVDRIATVRCRRAVLQYLSGSQITSSTIIKTSEKVTTHSIEFYETYIDEIKENSAGFVEGMEVLCSWESKDGKQFYKAIYKEIKN